MARYSRKDINYSTYKKVVDYIQKNQPVRNKSDIMLNERVDYNSINITLDILRKENKLDETDETIKLKNGN